MDADIILKELGHFGKYQISVILLLLLAGVYTTFFSISYVFTAGDLDYRCYIEQCDNNTNINENIWLHYAVPFKGKVPSKCYRYQPINYTGIDELDFGVCDKDSFLKNVTEKCNHFKYNTDETTIIGDFNLQCDENNWKRAAVGTVNNVGQFIGMPLGGLVSDRFGRKNMLTLTLLLSAIMGICRSFAGTYETFLIFEILDAVVTSGGYSACFILVIEILAPNRRVLGGVIIACFYTVGEVLLGIVAWYLKDWRTILRAIYAPGIIFIFYIWVAPESIRWLLTNKKYNKAKAIVERMSLINNVALSVEVRKQLDNLVEESDEPIPKRDQRRPSIVEKHKGVFSDVISSKIMVLRTINCSFSWFTNAFVFYGLSLNSVSIAGNKYFNFILVSLAEFPANLVTWIILDRIGRRLSLFFALMVSGCACIAFNFIPEGFTTIKLIIFVIGKCGITSSFSVLYVFSSELFPTNARHSLMGICSMFGRIGSMLAPLTPLLASVVDPTIVFGIAAIIAGLLGLIFPETLNQQLPDTIRQAEVIGKKKKLKATIA